MLDSKTHVFWQSMAVIGGIVLLIAGAWILYNYIDRLDLFIIALILIFIGGLTVYIDGFVFLKSFGYSIKDVVRLVRTKGRG